jgi:acyl transferase domain-containing protein
MKFISTVTGQEVNQELTDPEYWCKHITDTVMHAPACEFAWNAGGRVFIELGPESTLTKLCRTNVLVQLGAKRLVLLSRSGRVALLKSADAMQGVAAVWNAKAHSAWLLHRLTQEDQIQTFIMVSSITAAMGNPGQTSYGAANAYMDALMSWRNQRGLPGHSVQWPAVSWSERT